MLIEQRRLRMHVRQVLIGDLRQADLRDGQPPLLDEHEQQLEWPVEGLEV
jgi:hypothetical protein